MTALGIDIGGTKIELQVYGADWTRLSQTRRPTPQDYPGLIAAIGDLVAGADSAHGQIPVGISAAGLIDRHSGLAHTANLCATGRPFPADIAARIGRPVTFINDCQAMALSEARLGAGRGQQRVAGLVLGTGVGLGLVRNGVLDAGACGLLGEVGHISLPASTAARYGLPIVRCGCGRSGCIETLVSGPGLTRLARQLIGRDLSSIDIAQTRHTLADAAHVWRVWCDLAAELLVAIIVGTDPDIIVLGGGLSSIHGLVDDLAAALRRTDFPCLVVPHLGVAEGGDATGARGAALAASQRGSDP